MGKIYKQWFGVFFIFVSILLWSIERTTQSLSTFLGKLLCGEKYLQLVDGVVGDMSCGFNIDMHLTFILMVMLIFGGVLYISSKK